MCNTFLLIGSPDFIPALSFLTSNLEASTIFSVFFLLKSCQIHTLKTFYQAQAKGGIFVSRLSIESAASALNFFTHDQPPSSAPCPPNGGQSGLCPKSILTSDKVF